MGRKGETRSISTDIIGRSKTLTEEQYSLLSLNFTAEEIKGALFSILDEKSLGINGYSSQFFLKRLWILFKSLS